MFHLRRQSCPHGLRIDEEGVHLRGRQGAIPVHRLCRLTPRFLVVLDEEGQEMALPHRLQGEQLRRFSRWFYRLETNERRYQMDIPTALANPEAVWVLDLRFSRRSLEQLGAFTALRRLVLRGLPLGHLPESLREIPHLRDLDVSYTRLVGLPPWIGELRGLTRLDLRGLRLESLPPSLGQLDAVREVRVDWHLLMSAARRGRLDDGALRWMIERSREPLFDSEVPPVLGSVRSQATARALQRLGRRHGWLTPGPRRALRRHRRLLERLREQFAGRLAQVVPADSGHLSPPAPPAGGEDEAAAAD